MRYDIHEVLGRGGMGEVFRATDRETGQVVALKAMRVDLLLPKDLFERFEREGEALRRLNHPNIVKALGSYEHGGRRYLVMEFVSGGTLRALLSQPLAPSRLLGIALDVADALTRAHRLQIVHRDLKPDNVMLGDDGVARLADFGIAHFEGNQTLGGALGTLAYMSPEALRGAPAAVAQDVWAFGVMLFEMLTGQLPGDPLPDVSTLRPGVPVALADLIYRMLDRNPATRIPSVRQVGLELEALTPWEDSFAAAAPAPQLSTMLGSRYVVSDEPTSRQALPRPTQAWVGSEAELLRLEGLLTGLLTLVGPGGVGKSRLALELAHRAQDRFADGVVYVALAALDSAERLPFALAEALRFTFAGERTPLEQLAERLEGRQMLLVLDNFDDLAADSAWLGRLLTACPSVRFLVTSRVRLNLQAEVLHEVSELDSSSCEELFVALARRTRPDFVVDDVGSVLRIGRLVGGMPLGLELAAAWLRLLTPAEIADELERDLSLLESQATDADERHRSVRAVFESSWRQLTPALQQVLGALSVFRGGFTREAAQAVSGASLPGLLGLVDRSLLRRRASGRFEIHELVRQFAASLCADLEGPRDKHAAWYCAFLESKGKALDEGGRGWAELFGELEREQENCRVAWLRSVETSQLDNLGKAWQGLETYLDLRGRNEEIVKLLLPAVQCAEQGSSPRVLGKLITSQALLAGGDEALYLRALEMLADYPEELGDALTYHAYFLHFFKHRWEESRTQARAALVLPRPKQGKAFALTLVALSSAALGDDPTPELQEAERLYRLLEGPHLARFLGHRATLNLTLGKVDDAQRDALESMAMARELGDRPGTCKCLLILAQLSPGGAYAREALELGKSLASRSAVVRALALLARDLREGPEVLGHLNALQGLPAHARETLDLVLAEVPAVPPAQPARLSELVERFLEPRG